MRTGVLGIDCCIRNELCVLLFDTVVVIVIGTDGVVCVSVVLVYVLELSAAQKYSTVGECCS